MAVIYKHDLQKQCDKKAKRSLADELRTLSVVGAEERGDGVELDLLRSRPHNNVEFYATYEEANLNSLQWVLQFLSSIGRSSRLEEVKLDVKIPDSQYGQVSWPG
jgi:hypothetical protein